MSATWQHLATAFSITAHLVLLACTGMLCRQAGLIDQTFVHTASKLVFKLSLPCLLFLLVLGADWNNRGNLLLIAFSLMHTLVVSGLALLASSSLVSNANDRGVFVQGVFRGNMGIISLALVGSAYGTEGLAMAAVPVTLNTLLYNVLAVLLLSKTDGSSGRAATQAALLAVLRNPLILAIAAGLTAVWLDVRLPQTLEHSTKLLSQLALPLALLCVGASLQLSALTSPDRVAIWASIGKLIVAPTLAVTVGYLAFDIQGMPLGVLFFMAASPAATASFAMVIAFGGNAQLTAQIIAQTTVAAVFTIATGTFVLNTLGLM